MIISWPLISCLAQLGPTKTVLVLVPFRFDLRAATHHRGRRHLRQYCRGGKHALGAAAVRRHCSRSPGVLCAPGGGGCLLVGCHTKLSQGVPSPDGRQLRGNSCSHGAHCSAALQPQSRGYLPARVYNLREQYRRYDAVTQSSSCTKAVITILHVLATWLQLASA